jgi:hypothetical protein
VSSEEGQLVQYHRFPQLLQVFPLLRPAGLAELVGILESIALDAAMDGFPVDVLETHPQLIYPG